MPVGDNELRITVAGVLESLPDIKKFVTTAARRAGLDDRGIYHCQLATEEICTNIIEHGYAMQGDNRSIDVICKIADDMFTITITDDSEPFNPLEIENPDPQAPLENRHVGGWGIYFVKNLMDDVQYKYEHDCNHLTMVKYLRTAKMPNAPQQDPASSIVVKTLKGGQIVFVPQAALNEAVSRQLEQLLLKELNAGHKYLIVDMTLVDDLSSTGLKMLVSVWQRARAMKGDIVLARLTPEVRDIIQVVGFDLMFTIYNSVEMAAKKIEP
ncbi:MAG: STAS domain-containing protein [Chloroflexi bacterium]|nr:MAG: STAS domain-containing protein [Chloroflexota bacterium]